MGREVARAELAAIAGARALGRISRAALDHQASGQAARTELDRPTATRSSLRRASQAADALRSAAVARGVDRVGAGAPKLRSQTLQGRQQMQESRSGDGEEPERLD